MALQHETQPFDFSIVDDLSLAAERGRLVTSKIYSRYKADEIGPTVEYVQLAKTGAVPDIRLCPWLALGGFQEFVDALLSTTTSWICPIEKNLGVFRPGFQDQLDNVSWVSFCLEAQKCAEHAGFSKAVSKMLVAAARELFDNVFEHSLATNSGLVAFRGVRGKFEFVVADQGIGILESLKSCDEFANLNDHGIALETALTDGRSRFGSQDGRGTGFRPIFLGLSNLYGDLRFRTGDHALDISGSSPSLALRRLSQKATIQGFLVSVCCHLSCS
jgi:hypothetical protein